MSRKQNKLLVVVDTSYFLYYVIFGAVSRFQKRYPKEASLWIKPAEEVDQENLPDLLNCVNFRKILKEMTMKRCEVIDWVLKQNFQDDLDAADQIDYIFAMDDKVRNSFRKELYPEYKAQRALGLKQYKVQPIKDYITGTIFKELDVETKYGYKLVKVDGAEGDDVIAIIMKSLNGYMRKILFASDHDFLQIENVDQYDLRGKHVLPVVGNTQVSSSQYLLSKILLGDGADNIPKVFKGVGPKKALNLIMDPIKLDEMLKESQDSANQYILNEKLISFDKIPKDLHDRILESVNEQMYKLEKISQDEIDLSMFMEL